MLRHTPEAKLLNPETKQLEIPKPIPLMLPNTSLAGVL